MQQFNFKVVDAENPDSDVPVSVAGQIMVDVQSLLTHTGELMIRQELRTQNELPAWISDRFTLRMQGGGSDVGAGPRKDGDLLEDALNLMCSELDRTNLHSMVPEHSSNHFEAMCRKMIAEDILALSEHLEGYSMTYGTAGNMRRFRLNSRSALEAEASADPCKGTTALIGVILPDPARQNRWILSNGRSSVPLSFGDVDMDGVRGYAGISPVIATGAVAVDEDGRAVELTGVNDCFLFPEVRFHRIITADRDLKLLVPAIATPGYSKEKGLWTLCNVDLGISVSKPSWDEAVEAFHDYFMFLWETYAESDEEFEGEEKEICDLLLSMEFPCRGRIDMQRRRRKAPKSLIPPQ